MGISGNTLILTDKGISKMESLVSGHIDINGDTGQTDILEYFGNDEDDYADNMKNIKNVISLSRKLEYAPYNITAKYDNGENDMIGIKTGLGFEIAGTSEHKIIVINKDGNLVFKKLKDINEEDHIAITYNTNIFNTVLKLNFRQKTLYVGGYIQRLESISHMNEDIARLLGYIISEGNCGFSKEETTYVLITTYDEEMKDDIIKICRNLGIDAKYVYGRRVDDSMGVQINSMNFAEFLYYLGYKHLSQNKEIPWSILQADKKSQAGFIRSLFDGDGHVGIDRDRSLIEYGSSSYELCRQLQIMLLNFGIIGRLSNKKGAKLEYRGEIREYEESYRLSIYGENILKFADIIGFGLSRKQKILNDCIDILENTSRWTDITIPHIDKKLRVLYDRLILLGKMKALTIRDGNRIKYVAAKYYLQHHNLPNLFVYAAGGENYSRQPSRDRLRKILKILSPANEKNFDNSKIVSNIYSYLNSICDLFIFDKIEKINKKREKIYNMSVDNVNSYIGNGLINHN